MANRTSEPPERPNAWDHTPEPPVKFPGDQQTEAEILGCVLAEGNSAIEQAAAIISPEDFLLHSHKIAWGALLSLHERNEPITRGTFVMELRSTGKLETVGGLAWIVGLQAAFVIPGQLPVFCRKVKELSGRRRLMLSAQAMLDRAQDESIPLEEVIATTTASIESVSSKSGNEEDAGKTPEQIISDFPGGVESFLDPTLRRLGIPTGFTRLDELTSGLHEGELIVIGARPSMGKSAIALNIAEYLCLNQTQRRTVAFFSLEMTADSLLTRMLCSMTRTDGHKFRAGFLGSEDRRKLQRGVTELVDCRLKIFDKFGITIAEIAKHIRRLHKDEGLECAFIDYLGLVGVRSKGERRDLELSAMTRELKMLAGDCKIPIVVLSQLNRSNEKRIGTKEPILSDLRESGAIEQDSDQVWFIHRPEMYARDRDDLHGQAQVIISKNRNGPTGVVNLRFLHAFTRFVNSSDDEPVAADHATPRSDW